MVTDSAIELTRRKALQAVAALASAGVFIHPAGAMAAAKKALITVWKTPNCGCCKDWVNHLQTNRFDVVTNDVKETTSKREALGLAAKYASCHTAVVNGYVLEGHIPAKEILRMLRDRPAAVGLAVPGMPVGSPGMEMGTARDAYNVMLVLKDGSARVFQSYPAKAA